MRVPSFAMNIKFSVIIPVYNGASFVSKTIQSVLDQEYPAHEIIAIDDGSTDESPAILNRYKDQIITRRIQNVGCSGARNAGISMATGNYVAFLDHDDLWFKNRLKVQTEAILKYPEIGFFCCNYAVRLKHLGSRITKQHSALPEKRNFNFNEPLRENPFKLLIQGNFAGTPSAMVIKKEIIDQVGVFDARWDLASDLDYCFRCALHTNFIILSDVLMYKRTHDSNLSNDLAPMYLDHKRVLLNTLAVQSRTIAEHGLSKAFSLALAKINYDTGNVLFEEGDPRAAFALYRKGLGCTFACENILLFTWTVIKKLIRTLLNEFKGRKDLPGRKIAGCLRVMIFKS